MLSRIGSPHSSLVLVHSLPNKVVDEAVELSPQNQIDYFFPIDKSTLDQSHKLLQIIHELPDIALSTIGAVVFPSGIKSNLNGLELRELSSHGNFSYNFLDNFPWNFGLIFDQKFLH